MQHTAGTQTMRRSLCARRHNVGFMIVDELARAHSIDCRKLEKSAAVGKGTIAGKQVRTAQGRSSCACASSAALNHPVIAEAQGAQRQGQRADRLSARGPIDLLQVLLVKPMTFMNNSGEAVSALAKFYKVKAGSYVYSD